MRSLSTLRLRPKDASPIATRRGAGLLERDGRVVRADYDAIESSFRFEKTRADQAESTGVGLIA
jgi:hypothetical protein